MTKRAKAKAELLTQTDAARIIGVARQSIAGMVARGELRAETVAGMVFVTRDSAEALAKVRQAA